MDFEKEIMESGQAQRNTGLLFVIVSLMLLGTTILSAGVYLAYSAPGVFFWSDFIAVNTSILGFSMVFYMYFIVKRINL